MPRPTQCQIWLDTLFLQNLSNAARIQTQLTPQAEPLTHLVQASWQAIAY